MLKGQRIFITGGAGFIGSTLAGLLIEDNQVMLYDNLSRNSLKDCAFREHANLHLVEGDILDFGNMRQTINEFNPTHVVHCAAIAGIDTVVRSPIRTMDVNMMGTSYLLAAIAELQSLARVVVFSTSEVFGQQSFMSRERDKAVIGTVGEGRWTYAVSKLAGEHMALAYYKERGLPVTVLRPFNVYGPGQVGEGALSHFIQRALSQEPLTIHGDGTQIRAWCYVDDMVRGVMMALTHPRAVGESFNIGNQRTVLTIFSLASTVVRVLGSQSPIVFVEKDHVDVELRVPNTAKAREFLGFEAAIDLEEGIARTAKHISAQDLEVRA